MPAPEAVIETRVERLAWSEEIRRYWMPAAITLAVGILTATQLQAGSLRWQTPLSFGIVAILTVFRLLILPLVYRLSLSKLEDGSLLVREGGRPQVIYPAGSHFEMKKVSILGPAIHGPLGPEFGLPLPGRRQMDLVEWLNRKNLALAVNRGTGE